MDEEWQDYVDELIQHISNSKKVPLLRPKNPYQRAWNQFVASLRQELDQEAEEKAQGVRKVTGVNLPTGNTYGGLGF